MLVKQKSKKVLLLKSNTIKNNAVEKTQMQLKMNAIIKNSEQLLTIESQLASKRDEIAKKEIFYEKQKAKVVAKQIEETIKKVEKEVLQKVVEVRKEKIKEKIIYNASLLVLYDELHHSHIITVSKYDDVY